MRVAFEVIESLVTDLGDSASDEEELMEGDFVVVTIHGAKGISQRYIARFYVIGGDEIEGVFLKKIPGHRPPEGKQAFIIDHDDEASFHKQDILNILPTPKSFSGSLHKSNQLVFLCELGSFNLA